MTPPFAMVYPLALVCPGRHQSTTWRKRASTSSRLPAIFVCYVVDYRNDRPRDDLHKLAALGLQE